MNILRKLIAQLLYYIIKIWATSYRFKYLQIENRIEAPYIYALWHQNIIGALMGMYGKKHGIMVSRSKDGDLITYTLKKLNVIPVRGSSTRGGKEALKELIQFVKNGIPAALTIDGPKGPPFKAKAGIVELARQTGAPIIPIIVKANRVKTFNSWDKFILPLPFTTITITFAKPIYVKENISSEEFAQTLLDLEKRLNQ